MGIFTHLSIKSRSKKMQMFYEIFSPTEETKILDLGGEIDPNNRLLQLIDSYKWKNNITALNISPEHVSLIKNNYPEVDAVIGDACSLPWPDKYFDIIYSNAVIEHVGNIDKQKKMADEIMRVGKKWFITTPNRFYPFEFHMRLPLVTLLPWDCYLLVGRFITYNHDKNKYTIGLFPKRTDLRLMSLKELRFCFPDSNIIKQRITFWPETLIVTGVKHK